MRRRTFVASGLGLMATAASQGFVWTVDEGLRAQPATAPGTRSNATGSPQGKGIRLAPFPQATGERPGVASNGQPYPAQGPWPGSKPAGRVAEDAPARDAGAQQ